MIPTIELPAASRLQELFSYDPLDGRLRWKIRRGSRAQVGSVAGTVRPPDYSRVRIDGVLYLVHRVVWKLHFGSEPAGDIDHLNGDRTDNRLDNLRDVAHRTNGENVVKARKSNASGFLGVAKNGNKWAAYIHCEGATKYLGLHKSPELAHAAYLGAKRNLHEGCTL
jgi:hypothetical protein